MRSPPSIQPSATVRRGDFCIGQSETGLSRNNTTANVSIYGNDTRVRVTFQQRIVGPGGTVINVTRVEDAAFYQEFFAKVGKGIFLQQEGI